MTVPHTPNRQTQDYQALDAAHHMHPFTDANGLAAKGAQVLALSLQSRFSRWPPATN